jgi:hypothetical protein
MLRLFDRRCCMVHDAASMGRLMTVFVHQIYNAWLRETGCEFFTVAGIVDPGGQRSLRKPQGHRPRLKIGFSPI